jgi:hypothetical protein
MSGAIKIRSDGGDAVPVRAVARRATADINDPRPLRHEIFSADLLVTPIDSFILGVLLRAVDENESGRTDSQDRQIPS